VGDDRPVKIAGIDPDKLGAMAAAGHAEFKQCADRLEKAGPADLDNRIHEEHRRLFSSIDCLDCANCCKTTPALLLQEDMERIAGFLGISTSEFIKNYVEMDEDGDFVTNSTPCPFLGEGNYCRIYEVRPASCREFPLTLRPGQAAIMQINLANTAVCPAVYRIFEKLAALGD
jgi:Fe-S-cluster containining protein